MTLKGTVGVLLDEIPAGEWREKAVQEALERQGDDEFWVECAKRQARLTYYRLVFHGSYHPSGKGPLPLPPKTGWHIDIDSSSRRAAIGGHDSVIQDYTFRAYILSDVASPAAPEPQLATIGGTWSEPFLLPIALGGGVDCTFRDSLANVIVKSGGTKISFTCPAVRDASVAGTGGYSIYRAPLLSSHVPEPEACTSF